jgi:hypothetical protein
VRYVSVQRLPSLTSGERETPPSRLHHGICGSPPRSNTCSLRAVQAVRLLQAAVPISAAFTAPFYTRPDPGEDDVFRSSVLLLIARRTISTHYAVSAPYPSWRNADVATVAADGTGRKREAAMSLSRTPEAACARMT